MFLHGPLTKRVPTRLLVAKEQPDVVCQHPICYDGRDERPGADNIRVTDKFTVHLTMPHKELIKHLPYLRVAGYHSFADV